MPVEGVELMDFHYVKISLDHVHVKEMTHYVHVHSSVSETRGVVYLATWERPVEACSFLFSEDFCREHLLDCLDGVVESSE